MKTTVYAATGVIDGSGLFVSAFKNRQAIDVSFISADKLDDLVQVSLSPTEARNLAMLLIHHAHRLDPIA